MRWEIYHNLQKSIDKSMKLMHMKKLLLLTLITVGLMVTSCKKNKIPHEPAPTEEPKPSNANNDETGSSPTLKTVNLKVGTLTSSISNFKPTADEALSLLSKVLSSQEFKDSIAKYNYAPTNQLSNPRQCSSAKDLNIIKVNPNTGRINGTTVHDDLLKYKDVTLNLTVRDRGEPTTVMGSSSFCNFTIYSNDYWLKEDDNAMTLAERYATHLGHELCHILGYYHSSHPDIKTEDVSYGIGSLISNILWDWSLKEIKKKPLHNYLIDNSNWRLRCLAVEPAEMPQYGKFDDLLQLDISATRAANRSYNHFYLDFNPPEEQRKDGADIAFGVTTAANGAYWVDRNYYKINWINTADGTFKFTYIGNSGSSATTRNYSKNLRALLDSKTFRIIYSNYKGPSGRVIANFICVEDPEIFFYGKFERKWINWF